MDFKSIIKNSLLKEVGEATHQTFRSKKTYGKGELDDFTYTFKTKNGWKYDVSLNREWGKTWAGLEKTEDDWREELATLYYFYRKKYVNLRKMGATRDDLKQIWAIGFSVEEPHEEVDETQEELSGETKTHGATRWIDIRSQTASLS